jgi:hypothetical protein
MEMEKLAKDSKLHIRVHKLDSTKTQIIWFLAQKHLEETHINLYNKSYYVHASSAKECQNWPLNEFIPRQVATASFSIVSLMDLEWNKESF